MTAIGADVHSRTIQRYTRIFFALSLISSAVGLVLFTFALRNRQAWVETQRRATESLGLAHEMRDSSDELTKFARTYVATGDPRYKLYYEDVLAIRNGRKPRPQHYDRAYWDFFAATGRPLAPDAPPAVSLLQLMREADFTPAEFARLQEAEVASDALAATEEAAMHAVVGEFTDGVGGFTRRGPPDQMLALRLVNDAAYHRQKARIMAPLDQVLDMVDARTAASVARFERRAAWFQFGFGATVLAFFVMLAAAYPLVRRRILDPIAVLQMQTKMVAADLGRLAEVTERIARGDLHRAAFAVTARLLNSPRQDEIGELSAFHDSMIRQLQETGESVARITGELSNTQRDLDIAHRELLTIIDQAPAGLMILNPDRSIRVRNREATQLLGVPPAEPDARHRYFTSIVYRTSKGAPLLLDETPPMRALLEGLEQHGVEVEIQRPDGHRAVVLCGATPLCDAQGEVTGVVASFQNVTELRDLDRMKDEFVAIVSHELRTPLTAIRGSLQLLIADAAVTKEEDRELLDVGLHGCERLIRIVNDMLDLSKLEAGKLELNLTPTDVENLVDRGVAAIATVARERGVTVASSVPNSLPRVRGDVDRLTQVLVNLLSNAIKFAPTGSTVTVSAEAREGTVVVGVADQGIGISAADLPRLFRKFEQLGSAGTRRAGGTGLGLSISKGIVEQHGGTLDVESAVGVGTTFRFSLPLAAPGVASRADSPQL